MDASQNKPQKQFSFWHISTALFVFFGLSLLIQHSTPSSTKKVTAFASASNPKEKVTESSPSPPAKNQRSAAPLAPSAKRALEKIRASAEIQEILKDPKSKLIEAEKIEGLGVWTMKYQHVYDGVEVLGSMATYHQGPAGEQVRSHLKEVKIDTEPQLSAERAEQLALQKVGKNSHPEGHPHLKILPEKDAREAKLIYSVQVRDLNTLPHEVWIDAKSGDLISDMSRREEFSRSGGAQ